MKTTTTTTREYDTVGQLIREVTVTSDGDPSEPDFAAFYAELRERADEIEGSLLTLDAGVTTWIHTQQQVRNWLDEAWTTWNESDYLTEDET